MNSFLTLLKKDLKRMLTDKRILASIVLPGILMFVIYSFMGKIMTKAFTKTFDEYKIVMVNEPAEYSAILDNDVTKDWKISYSTMSKDEALESVKNKDIDCYIEYPENFITLMNEYVLSTDPNKIAPNVEIYYNSVNEASSSFYNYYQMSLNQIESSMNNMFDINRIDNENVKFDLSTSKDQTGMFLGMIVPFLLIIMLFSGAMGLCADAVAGEKERGTIATLLVTPVKRTNIALAKICSLSIVAFLSAAVSSLGLLLSVPNLVSGEGMNLDLSTIGFGAILLLIIVIVVTSLLLTTLLSIISTFAKSTKEATSYSVVPMFIIMAIGITSIMSTKAATNPIIYLIPVYNSLQCFTGIFTSSYSMLSLALTIISNLVFIALGAFVMAKMFNSEKIMFNK